MLVVEYELSGRKMEVVIIFMLLRTKCSYIFILL